MSLSSPARLLGGKTVQCLEMCHVLGPISMPWHILLGIYRTAGAGLPEKKAAAVSGPQGVLKRIHSLLSLRSSHSATLR